MSGFSQFCIKMCSLKMLSGFGSHSPHTLHCNAESRSRSGLRFIWIRIQRVKIKPQIFRSQGGLPYNTGYGSFHFRSEVVPVSLLKDITFSHIPSLHPTSLLCQLAPSKLLVEFFQAVLHGNPFVAGSGSG